MTDETFEQHLQAGIAAARSGKKVEARAALRNALQKNPRSATAWLWMSGVIATPQEREKCLERVLALEPDNTAARKGLPAVRAQVTAALLREGLAQVETGPPTTARETLMHVLERDEENVAAWLGLSEVAETLEDIEICLENAVTLDPEHTGAQFRLGALREEMAARDSGIFNPWTSAPEPEPPPRYASVATEVLGEEFARRQNPEEPEPLVPPDPPSVQLWAKFDDERRCPYCAASTNFDDRRCAACKHSLWLKVPRREKHSTLLLVLMALQAANTLFMALVPIIALSGVGMLLGVRDPFSLLPLYFGGKSEAAPEATRLVLQMLPPLLFFLMWLPTLFSTATLVGLYLRWTPLYYIMLVSAVLQVLVSFIALLQSALIPGGIGVGLAVFQFFIILQVEDDFIKDRIRILLRPDEDIKGTTGLLMRGRLYASQGLWALAAIHYRRAAATVRNEPSAHLALAAACIKLHEYDLAASTLAEARVMLPNDPKIAQLEHLLEQQRQRSSDG